MALLLVLAVFVIYVILGILYESFIHPVTILTGLPFATFGALVTLVIAFGLDLDIYGFVGIIMLIGIVEKNAIRMMIRFCDRGTARWEQRLRRTPFFRRPASGSAQSLMTTMAALMGALPIAVGCGGGRGDATSPWCRRRGRPRLFATGHPIRDAGMFYTYLDGLQTWFANRKTTKSESTVAAPPVDGTVAPQHG